MNPVLIRDAVSADIERISSLVNEAYRRERFFIDEDRTSPAKVRELLAKGKFLTLVHGTDIVGTVYVSLQGERGYFGLLAVDPAKQRSGHGSRLVTAAEDYCRGSGCRFMDMTVVNLRTELPPYYRRLGYLECGVEAFPADQRPKLPVHLIRMEKRL
jgi:N-acetylglutamate synthase-like GNAT family acetyltransferase